MDMEGLVGQKAAVFVRKGRAFWPFFGPYWKPQKLGSLRGLQKKGLLRAAPKIQNKMSAGEILARTKKAKRLVYQKHIPYDSDAYHMI